MSTIEERYRSYHSFHQDPTNKKVHLVGVPIINWTILVFISYLSLNIFVNAALLASIAIPVYYFFMDQRLGGVAGGVFLVAWPTSYAFYYFVPYAWMWALMMHTASWAVQVYSHRVFEGNSPAVLKHPFSALVMAPAFIMIEVANQFGYLNDISDGSYSSISFTKI